MTVSIGIGAIIAKAVIGAAATVGATYIFKEMGEWLSKTLGKKKYEETLKENNVQPETVAPTTPSEKTEETPKTNGITIQRPDLGAVEEPNFDNSKADSATDLPSESTIVGGNVGSFPLEWLENSNVESLPPKEQQGTQTPPVIQGVTGGTLDKTGENEEVAIKPAMSTQEWMQFIEKNQKEQWAREDAIRKETQAREDTAYQRSVADMLKAGINPNLMNVQPASSGGGITQATGKDLSGLLQEIEIQANALQKELDRAFQADQNAKDRAMGLTGDMIQNLVMMILLGGKTGKGG